MPTPSTKPVVNKAIFKANCRFCPIILRGTSDEELMKRCASHVNLRHPEESAYMVELAKLVSGLQLRRYFRYHQMTDEERDNIRALRTQVADIVLGAKIGLNDPNEKAALATPTPTPHPATQS